MIVVPDMTGSRAPGPKIDGNSRAGFKNKGAGQSAESRELDLTKDYNYKLCFLASYVQPSDAKVTTYLFIDLICTSLEYWEMTMMK